MEIFKAALKFTLSVEGGYVSNPNDPGGETNRGITKLVYDAYRKKKGLSIQSVKNISDSEVYDIYKNQYWFPSNCDKMIDPKLAISVFDFAVNGGVSRAKRYSAITSNYQKYNQLRKEYYGKITNKNPNLRVFYKGWMSRMMKLEDYIKAFWPINT